MSTASAMEPFPSGRIGRRRHNARLCNQTSSDDDTALWWPALRLHSWPKISAFFLVITLSCTHAWSSSSSSSSYDGARPPMQVLVTGASGKTGQLIFQALARHKHFSPRALVRSERSGQQLRRVIPEVQLEQIGICDVVTQLDNVNATTTTTMTPAAHTVPIAAGCTAMVICTAAVPRVCKRSVVRALLLAPWNMVRGRPALDFRHFRFKWKMNQYPERVDYAATIHQIELARRLHMQHVVLVSSMGGTDPHHFLNSVGKRPNGSGHGDILKFKRQAELVLVQSGLDYTIIHPGGLVDTPGGQIDYELDVDDVLLQRHPSVIARADVAGLCVAALTVGRHHKLALDCITTPRHNGVVRPPELALAEFIASGKQYNYELPIV